MPITLIHRGGQKEKVSPADCALLVGIPLDRASFLDKYSRSYEGNFAQSVGDVGVELGWIGYSRLIGGIPALLDDIEALGVRVCRALTPETLSIATRSNANSSDRLGRVYRIGSGDSQIA
jgi:hypothetical protein